MQNNDDLVDFQTEVVKTNDLLVMTPFIESVTVTRDPDKARDNSQHRPRVCLFAVSYSLCYCFTYPSYPLTL